MIPVVLPQMSISMEDGKVLRWLVADGDEVRQGQPVVEVETDKATVEVEATGDGRIRLVVAEGAVVGVDATLAEILDESAQAVAPPPAEEPAMVAPAAAPGEAPAAAAPGGARAAAAPANGRKHVASPAARRIARERGIDLDRVEGSGPGGRIVARDLDSLEPAAPAAPASGYAGPPGGAYGGFTAADLAAGSGAPAPQAANVARSRRPGSLREAVLANIAASWQQVPHIHIAGELAADGLAEAKARAPRGTTVTDLLVLALARALADVPDLNGFVRDSEPQRSGTVSVSIAVATAQGVVAPAIRDVASLGLPAITRERARLVEAARSGSLEGRDLSGGTITLSNLGAYPVDFFAPVVSGPQIAMIATGRLAQKPVAVDGMLAIRHRLTVNAAIDHRGADGEAGGRFLAALERRLADLPATI